MGAFQMITFVLLTVPRYIGESAETNLGGDVLLVPFSFTYELYEIKVQYLHKYLYQVLYQVQYCSTIGVQVRSTCQC